MVRQVIRLVSVLSLLAGSISAQAVPATGAPLRTGSADPVNSVPEQQPVDPAKVAVGSSAETPLPQEGSPRRKDIWHELGQEFEKRMTTKRNRDENGCRVPWQGLNERPRTEGE